MKKWYLVLALSCLRFASFGAAAVPACLPTAASWNTVSSVTYGINTFNITGYSGSNLTDAGMTAATSTTTGYLNRLAITPVNMLQGGVYAASATWGTVSSYQELQVWIDFNDDGVFQVTEAVSPVTGFSTGTTVSPTNFNITIPAAAATGLHLMRLRGIWEQISTTLGVSPANLDPCLVQYLATNPKYWSGNVVDYIVNIISPCPFTATAGNAGPVCPGSPVPLTGTTTAPSYTWTGPGGFTSTLLSPNAPGISVPGTYTFVATNGTCTTTLTTNVTLNSAPPVPVVTPSVSTICNGGIVTLTATVPPTPGTILSQNFNSGIAPWTVNNTGTTSASGLAPWQPQPNGYTYLGTTFNSPDATQFAICNADAGGSGTFTSTRMTSPIFSLVGYTAATLTFQHYYNRWASGDVSVNIEISTNGGVSWTVINNYFSAGVGAGTSTAFATATWPLTAYLGNANCQIRFNYQSTWGFYWAIDNVLITGTPTAGAAPTWTPVTNLFTNPACTIPYTAGTPASVVYVHPTSIVTPTTFNYIASLTGTCTSSDTGVVTVNPGLPAITGPTTVCTGGSISLSNTTGGGTWTRSNTTVASVNAANGVVTGLAVGVDTIYYTVTGCTSFTVITVGFGTPITSATGFLLCSGGTATTLSNATGGGTWTTNAPSIASVNSSGVVTSGAIGSAIITYTMGSGCSDTALITVIGLPNPITGSMIVCYGGGVTTLSETTGGGSWSSGNPSIASVGSSGDVHGVSGGVATISYIMPSGCYVTASVTVNAPIAAIAGPSSMCIGNSISLTDASGGGSWTSGSPAIATITSGGLTGGASNGTSIITYSTSVGCNAYKTITVNPLPVAITGPSAVCAGGATITLTNSSGAGTWSSSGPSSTATISGTGVVSGVTSGNVTITYTLSATGCYITTPITVNPLPANITGASAVCENGATVTVADATTPGTWSAGPAGTLSVNATGTVTGGTAGPGTVTYTISSTGCFVTRFITVNPVPSAITGTPVVCLGLSATLADGTGGGTWSSSNTGIVTVDPVSGTMYGAGAGNALVLYTLTATGCSANVLATVNPLPGLITGATSTVCANGATIVLNDTTLGGTWSSGAPSVATATGTISGVITGVSAGTAPVTYTITSTGCIATTSVTVLPVPAPILGTASVCEAGSVTNLSDATTPGNWSISPAGIATVSSFGAVTGIAAGNATVTYTRSNNCFITQAITVNPLPAALVGPSAVCDLSTISLTSTSGGGTWSTGSAFVATVSGGNVTGLNPGTAAITYTLGTGCLTSKVITVNPIPGTITGDTYVCFGHTTVVADSVAGGTWSSSPTSIATIDASGTVYGVSLGTFDVTYTTGTSACFSSKPMTVNPIVPTGMSLTVNPGTTVCAGTPVTFIANPVNGGSSPLYVWSVNNVILSGASSYSYTPANGDLVRCWIISSYSCAQPDTASAWVHMVVNPIVTPGLSLSTAGGDTVCAGAAAVISAVPVAGGPTPVYQWVVNLAPVPGATPVLTYTPANGDIIHCTMISNAPCSTAPSASATKVLTVSPPLTPLVGLTASMGPTVCEGYPNIYTATQINGGWSPTYQWTISGGPVVSTSPVYGYTPTNGDLVQVTMTSSFPCLTTPTATNTMLMTVVPIVTPVGTISVTPGYIIAPGTAATFNVTIVSGGGLSPSYQWMVNAVPIAGATNTTFTISTLNNGDSVSCMVTNTDLCSSISTFNAVQMTVGYNTGIRQTANASGISLVPNPNNGTFVVKGAIGTTDEEALMEVTDMVGQVVYSSKAQLINGQLNEHISLQGKMANGMYLLNVKTPSVSKVFHFVLEQ